jgi:signal transduction histidine kinase
MQKLEMGDSYNKALLKTKCVNGLFSHDISNLFHSLSNAFELCLILLKKEIRNEDILEYFKLIEEQINRGKKLVRDFRKLSELEDSMMPLEPIDLLKILNNAVKFVQVIFSNRKIRISINSKEKRIHVMANDLLLDVCENIFINSVNYNKNQTVQIEVSISEILEVNKKFIKLEVKDNGVGIAEKRKYEILQEDSIKSEESKGMGIGLSLVAMLINLYKGKMWIEDRIRGDSSKGSKFIILIPKAM